MQLSRFAVRRPVTTMMAFLAIVMLGIVSYRQLPIQFLPDITLPTIGIYMFRESSPDDTLQKLTKPVEDIVAQLPRLKETHSWTGPGWTWIRADFEFGTDTRFTTLDLQERMNKFQQGLEDRRTMIQVFPFSTDFQNTFMYLSLQGPNREDPAFKDSAEKARDSLKAISGVAKVEVGGLTANAATVTIDPNLLGAYELGFEQVIGKVQAAASENDFLGTLDFPGQTHYVRLNDRVQTVEELRNVIVDNEGIVRLEDVATVEEGEAVDGWVYRANGNYACGLEVSREAGTNLIELAHKTRARVEEINKGLPNGIHLEIDTDLASFVEDALAEIQKAALIGAGLALLVPFLFFRSFRISSVIFLSVPVCILSVFNLFLAAKMSINVFSIVGLALGVGMLVDNSIVVVENSLRLFFGRRLSAKESAERGGDEVGRALLASTLAIVVVFLPLAFVPGTFRLLVREPALALVFPLALSLLTALTLAPVLTHGVLRAFARKIARKGSLGLARQRSALESNAGRMRELYRWMIKGALRNRGQALFLGLVLTAIAIVEAGPKVSQATLKANGGGGDDFSFFAYPPSGSKIADTSRAVGFIESRLKQHTDLKQFEVYFRSDSARFNLLAKKLAERPSGKNVAQLRQSIIDFVGPVPGAELSLERRDEPISEGQIKQKNEGELTLKGLDFAVLRPYSERLIDALRTVPTITNAEVKKTREDPEYQVVLDREKAKLFDVNANLISQYVRSTQAKGSISRLQLKRGEETTDVSFEIGGMEGETLASVKAMPIFSKVGGQVPLGSLATFRPDEAPGRIERQDRQSSMTIKYYFVDGVNATEVAADVRQLLLTIPNPGGVVAEIGGDVKEIENNMRDLALCLLMGLLFIYIVMASIFESLWIPATIAATVPFLSIGVILGLAVTGLPFDPLAQFGCLVLLGLSVNNGIVLMDQALRYRFDRGYSRIRSVFQAADQRLRPILMTYLTTTLGLLPLAIFGDEDSSARSASVSIIGGYTTATILTLVFLPCLYLIGDDFMQWFLPYWNWASLGLLRGSERLVNGTTRLVIAIVMIWRWRPLRWPRAIWQGVSFVARTSWRFAARALPAAWGFLRRVLRVLRGFLGDARYFAGLLVPALGRRAAPVEMAEGLSSLSPVAISQGTPDSAPLSMQNIQVIYPAGGWKALRNMLPARGYAIGHRPIEGVQALAGISMEIQPGLYGLLGPNGAGKTTLMRCIAGLLEPTRGTVRLFGVAHREAPAQLAPLVGYLPQNHGHYEWMTLKEYLDYFATMTARTLRRARLEDGRSAALLARQFARLEDLGDSTTRARAILRAVEEVHLTEFLNEKIGSFSGGMKQRAGIARILLQAPPFLIVDEPTAGLDPVERVKVRLLLSHLAQTRTVLFSTHIVEDLAQACTQVGILQRGHLLYSGPPEELMGKLEGRVWEVEAVDEDPEELRAGLLARGCRVLFRIARRGGAGWRVLSEGGAPHERAERVIASLEDALLATLQART